MDDIIGLGECASALATVTNHFMDKIEHACGWFATPKGTSKDKEEAVNYLISEIKNDSNMPSYLKVVKIANARKIIKEYSNQLDIASMAAKQLNPNAKPEDVEDDWISRFFEEAKFVSNEDIKVVWSKLLANECEKPGTIPKSLIHSLSYIGVRQIKAFNIVSKCTILMGKYPIPFIDWKNQYEFYKNIDLNLIDLEELNNIGLIQFREEGAFNIKREKIIFHYGDITGKLSSQDGKVSVGQALYSEAGKCLFKAISNGTIDNYIDVFVTYMNDLDYSINL